LLDDQAMNQATSTPERTELGRSTLLHLPDGLGLRFLDVTDRYWDHRADNAELDNGRIVSIFDYSTTWSWWERHPDGDEFVHLITGEVDFLVDTGHHESAVHLAPGEGTIVPQGAWHRAVVHCPSKMLFITPTPARTEHRDAAELS
jgi:uncharacterized cupin superfamily protein